MGLEHISHLHSFLEVVLSTVSSMGTSVLEGQTGNHSTTGGTEFRPC